MADADVDIKINGDATGVQAAFKQASDAAQAAVESIGGAFGGLGAVLDTVREHLGALTAILAGGAAFKESIDATKEFTGEVTQLSRQLGISSQEASGLNVALETIGADTETYSGALSKLTRQVRTNEESLNAMGIATRDSNGQYLDGRELMDSAIKTINTYKEGTDRNLAAQVAFGKGAQESAALLKLNNEVQEEGAKKARELNLIIGPENQAAVKTYKVGMIETKEVFKALEVTIGEAIIPALGELANWFADAGPAAVSIFKPVMSTLGTLLSALVDIVKDVWSIFVDAFHAIGEIITAVTFGEVQSFGETVRQVFDAVSVVILGAELLIVGALEGVRLAVLETIGVVKMFGSIVVAAMTGEWSDIVAAWKTGTGELESILDESAKRLEKKGNEIAAKMKELITGETFDFGKKGKDWEEPDKKFKEPKPKKDPDTQMAGYEAELAAMKLAIEEKNALNHTFFEMSKAEEAAFWKSKEDLAENSERVNYAVAKKYVDLRVAMNKDEFDNQLANLKKQEEAIKYDYDQKIAIAAQEVALIREKFGTERKEYQDSIGAIRKLGLEKLEQQIKVNEQIADNRKKAALDGIDLEEQQAELAVQLMQKTDAQLLVEQQGFENRRYAIQVEALQERLRLASFEKNPVEIAKINGELEQLEIQHQARIGKIQGQAALQQGQLMRSVYGSLQAGFGNMISGMLQGTLKMKDIMRQTFASIADALGQAVAKMVADWIIGEVEKTAASKAANAEQIQAAAGEAAANAYNAIVGIPYVGPFLAPAAAAVAYAGVMAFAEDGYDIPGGVNPVVQAHAREMILPAKHADVIRSIADSGGGAQKGGDTHVTNNFNGPTSPREHERWLANLLPGATQISRRNFGGA